MAGEAVREAIICGNLLIQAKETIAHGNWQKWIRENFEGSYETSARYVKLAKLAPVTDLNNARGLKETYQLMGILAKPEGNPGERSDIRYEDKFIEVFGRTRGWINGMIERLPVEAWRPEFKKGIKEHLKPIVDFYNRIG